MAPEPAAPGSPTPQVRPHASGQGEPRTPAMPAPLSPRGRGGLAPPCGAGPTTHRHSRRGQSHGRAWHSACTPGACPVAPHARGRLHTRMPDPWRRLTLPPAPCTSQALPPHPSCPPRPVPGAAGREGVSVAPPPLSRLMVSGPPGAWASGCPAGSAHPCGRRSPPGGPLSQQVVQAGRSWRPGAGRPGTSGSAAGESRVSSGAGEGAAGMGPG